MKGCIPAFPKKGDLGWAKNYRGITLTSIAAKIYNALLRNRIEPKIDNILRKNQNGFRRNTSTTSQILTIRGIHEGVRAKNLQVTILFVDFTKAFDSIQRGKMEQILLAYGIPKDTVVLYSHMLQLYIYTCRIYIDTMNKDERRLLKKKIYLSLYLKGCVCERELETEQNCNILTPTLMATSVVSFSFSRAAQPEPWGPSLLGAGFLYRILSPTGLQTHWGSRWPLLPGGGFLYHILSPTSLVPNSSDLQLNRGSQRPPLPGGGFLYHIFSPIHLFSNSSDLQLTDFLSLPSYIIVQSPTQSLEWHVWSSSSGNNCHEVHRSLSLFRCISLLVYHGIFTLSHFFSQVRLRDFFS